MAGRGKSKTVVLEMRVCVNNGAIPYRSKVRRETWHRSGTSRGEPRHLGTSRLNFILAIQEKKIRHEVKLSRTH